MRTDRLPRRVRADRRIAQLAAAGLLGAVLSPGLAAGSAAAAPCQVQAFTAAAAADLVRARLLDLRPLGVEAPALAGVTVASARSRVDSTAATKSYASADHLDADLLGESLPAGPLDAAARQSAPPDNPRPAVVRPQQLDADLLRIGTAGLTAHATWKPGYGCRTAQGVIAQSSGSDLDANLLPAMTTKGEAATSQLGDGLVSLPSNVFSRTATGLARRDGAMTTAATAWTGLTELVLFGGTAHRTTVRVINPPELTAYATGAKRTSSVEYRSPLLEIVTPDGTAHRIDAPGQVFTITVPPGEPRTVTGGKSGPESGTTSPRTPERPGLDDVLPGGDTPGDSGEADRGLVDGLIGGLTGSRDPGGGSGADSGPDAGSGAGEDSDPKGRSPEADHHPEAGGSRTGASGQRQNLTVRLSLGQLESRITGTAVRAEAASLRLQLLATRGDDTATLADLGVGMLKVRATAPGVPTPSQPPVTTPPAPGGGGSLPTTGFNLMAVLATGALLLVAGRFLMVVARRRTTTGPPEM